MYSGNDDQTVPFLSLGGRGVISVFANLFPKEMHLITEKYLNGNISESRNLFFKALPIMNMLFDDINPMPVKEAMKMIGFNVGKCRMPLTSIENSLKERLKQAILKYKNGSR